MMRFRIWHIVALLGCLSFIIEPLNGYGQSESSFSFGPFIAYEYGVPLTIQRSPGEVEWCTLCDGTGNSYNHVGHFGIFATSNRFKNLQTNVRLSLGVSSGEFTSNPYNVPLASSGTQNTIETSRLFTVNSFIASLDLQAQLEIEIQKGWYIGLGPWVQYWLFSRLLHREIILTPDDVFYSGTSSRTRILNEGDVIGTGPFAVGGIISTSTAIKLSPRLQIVPNLYARIDGEAIINGLGIRGISLGTSLSFRQLPLPLPKSPPSFNVPPPPIVPPPPPKHTLSAQIDLYALNESGKQIEEAPLLPRTILYRRHRYGQTTTETTINDVVIPPIGVTPSIIADAGVLHWTLSIRQDKEEIIRLTSEDLDQSLILDLEFSYDSIPQKLTAELIVEDSMRQLTAAKDDLLFVITTLQDSSSRGKHNFVENQWLLPIPENIPTKIKESTKEYLQQIIDSIDIDSESVFFLPSDSDASVRYAQSIIKYFQELGYSLPISIQTSLPDRPQEIPPSHLLLTVRRLILQKE